MNLRIGYAPGVYDLFHIGHLNVLRNARNLCDYLIAGVVSDEMCQLAKGKLPVIPLVERLEIVAGLRCVDRAVVEYHREKLDTWREIGFSVIFKGDDWRGTAKGDKLERDFAGVGVDVVYLPYTVHTSSSLLRRVLYSLDREAPPVALGPMSASIGHEQAWRSPSSQAARLFPDLAGGPVRLHQTWSRRLAHRIAMSDAIVIAWAAVGAALIVTPASGVAGAPSTSHPGELAFVAGLSVIWFALLRFVGRRDGNIVTIAGNDIKAVVRATLALFGALACGALVLPLERESAYALIMMPSGLVMLLAGRLLWRRWLRLERAAGRLVTRVLAVGDHRTVDELVTALGRAPDSGYRVVAACVPDGIGRRLLPVPVAGNLDEVLRAVRRVAPDVVAVTSSGSFGSDAVRELGWALESTDVELVLAPALVDVAGPRVCAKPVAGLPLLRVAPPQYYLANRLLKRIFDLVGAAALLVVLTPVLIATAIAIRVDSPGAIFFRQERIGIAGRSFRMIKFRSMVQDAEARLSEVSHNTDAGNEVLFKIRQDPRTTAVGRIIRRYSVDELPQLLNVLAGSMSLVGPRPPLMSEVERYGPGARRRLLVKPGMTGLWQISGRSNLTWKESLRLDMYYVENWSLATDLMILWRTAKVVITSEGAY